MDCTFGKKWSVVPWGRLVLLLLLLMRSACASAWVLETGPVSNGYSQCSWTDNGNGTVTLGVTIGFNQASSKDVATSGNGGNAFFYSRGIQIYLYDKNGNIQSSSLAASSVTMNGVKHGTAAQPGNYTIYTNLDQAPWTDGRPFTANVTVTISKTRIGDWLGVSIRAANYTSGNDVGEITGAAYVTTDRTGGCTYLDPTVKPPPPPPLDTLVLKVTAPDWDLGELPRGDSQKMFTDPASLLCFETMGAADGIDTVQFVIRADNQNGKVGVNYLLKNAADATQAVPYWIKLSNAATGTATMLPNDSSISVPLIAGRNCFIPTFSTSVGNDVKGGNYSDVLTFTVFSKS
ncbi:hypothetical protein BLA13014_06510 [Burkholderia aenigmatica]|uniref:Spore coat protein U domain-containing protein n=1 Tax=Burkholderia aenigmatica TaxID=2015348 RepID=A0A6P2REP2_9BURK|nr:hypothetical protein [Burkholderia aenigmatica]VWC35249.1 hypothetical protein BLA13014_06510 [Burkholderia aenigmatica]